MNVVEIKEKKKYSHNYSLLWFFRRQELRELRLLQKEEQRAQQQLSNKLQQQREQIFRRFEQETTVSHFSCAAVVSFSPLMK